MINSKPHKTYHIASKFRFSVFIILVTSLLIVGIYFMNAQGVFGGEKQKFETVYVHKGDTIWGIAEAHTPAGKDIRNTVYKIRRANDLSDNVTIYAGEVIVVPV